MGENVVFASFSFYSRSICGLFFLLFPLLLFLISYIVVTRALCARPPFFYSLSLEPWMNERTNERPET